MGVLEELKAAIIQYPTNQVVVSSTSFAMVSQGVLNVNDIFQFKIKVANNGCLGMTNVMVAVYGTKWAQVAPNKAGPFQAVTGTPANARFSVPAFGSYETGWFYGKATLDTAGQKVTIVTAKVSAWDASLDFILNSESMAGPLEGHLDEVVYPI